MLEPRVAGFYSSLIAHTHIHSNALSYTLTHTLCHDAAPRRPFCTHPTTAATRSANLPRPRARASSAIKLHSPGLLTEYTSSSAEVEGRRARWALEPQ